MDDSTKSPNLNGSTCDINLLNMIESRIIEIIDIEKLARKKRPKLFSQRLPRYMRRRAACHNIKRLPLRVRNLVRKPEDKSTKTKDIKKLLKYRRRLRFRKHKRVLRKHKKADYRNPMKCLLHKWFAKRFNIGTLYPLSYIPIHNNTKNWRTIQRHSVYGCAFLSMAHLMQIIVKFDNPTKKYRLNDQFDKMNRITTEPTGFTFCALALERCRYEIVIKLLIDGHEISILASLDNYSDSKQPASLTLWVPVIHHQIICDRLKEISKECTKEFVVETIMPKYCTRIRLLGPDARTEALKVCENRDLHNIAIDDAIKRCKCSFGFEIGRHIKDTNAEFTYYNTKPEAVDISFKGVKGRLLYYQLVKHKAHLVGGKRDHDQFGFPI